MRKDLILVKPSKELEQSIREYCQEYFDFGEKHINGSSGIVHYNDFDEWLDVVLSIEKEKLSRDGIHASTFLSVRQSDNKIIGTIQLRHSLTKELEKHGGHIGYGIRPTERNKGYGREQLSLVLDVAKELNLGKVMITCDKDNLASSRTAISCGGKLTCEYSYNEQIEQIYWIDIHP